MPLPFFVTTSDSSVSGQPYTRMKGLILSGSLAEGSTAGPQVPAAGVALIQPISVVSTLGQLAQVLSTAAASVSVANYLYITQTTGPVSTSSFGSGASAPPLTGMGAALIWDAGRSKLGVYSTVAGGWLWSATTGGIAAFTSS